MTQKKYLSEKKTSNQNISISPALKEWVSRYVSVKRKEHPNDERYKSISAFYCHVMENVLKMFEKGKSLDDFKDFIDGGIRDLWDEFHCRVLIDTVEILCATHKYSDIDINKRIRFLLAMRKSYEGENESDLLDGFKSYFERSVNYIHDKKVFDYANLDIIRGKNKLQDKVIFEFRSKYKNIHYHTLKGDATLIGMLGGKITKWIHVEEDFYSRLNLVPTELTYTKKLALKERRKLVNYNLKFFTNLGNVVKDKDFYLWMKMAEDNDLIVSFKSEKVFDKWIEKIETDLVKFGDKEEFLLNMLRVFERIHWIKIENEDELRFQFELPDEKYADEKDLVLDYLLKHANVVQADGKYYLEGKGGA